MAARRRALGRSSTEMSLDTHDLPADSSSLLRPSNEKEVCNSHCLGLRPSISDTNLGGRGTPASWRSISLDPLSKPIVDASKMILSIDSPVDMRSSSDLSDNALVGGGVQIDQRDDDELPCADEDPLRSYARAVMTGLVPAELQVESPDVVEESQVASSGPARSRSQSSISITAQARAHSAPLCTTPADANRVDPHEMESGGTVFANSVRDNGTNSVARQRPAVKPSDNQGRKQPPSPRTLRQDRYELMCCTGRESNRSSVRRESLSTASSDNLYSATPPKRARLADKADASLYPDPLQLTRKFGAVSLGIGTRLSDQASHALPERCYSTLSTRCRRNTVGALAELEGEPMRPPTRSSSCSSLPPYESIIAGSRRIRPSRYHGPLGAWTSASLRQDNLSTPKEQTRVRFADGVQFAHEKTPAATRLPSTPTFVGRKPADEALQVTKVRNPRLNVQYAIRISNRTWYERDKEDTTAVILDQERIRHIVHSWNERSWDHAEQYLQAHLNEICTGSPGPSSRRVQHLLGVCASFKGEWDEAIKRFIKVVQKPISNLSDLDGGDCAAAYWLGDLYTMQNRRADALLAYSHARQGGLFDDEALQSVIRGERMAVQLGVSKCELKRHWSQEALMTIEKGGARSILSNDIIAMETARSCLEHGRQERRDQEEGDSTELLRACHLYIFLQVRTDKQAAFPELFEHMAMKIETNCLDPDSPWPMPYDPLFCMANVQRGRLLAYECDMLKVFNTNPEAKLPRRLANFDCFTCSELMWLITNIRACLRLYETDYSEVFNVQGTWFCCRYSFMQHKVATTHYFSIALFKHPFRSSYGVEVCSDEGMGSARIMETAGNYKNGVHHQEPKRIKRLIRKYLDEAAKREHSKGRKASGHSTQAFPLPSQYNTT